MIAWKRVGLAAVVASLFAISAMAQTSGQAHPNDIWDGTKWRKAGGNSAGSLNVNTTNSYLIADRPGVLSTKLIPGNFDSTAAYNVAGSNHIIIYATVSESSATCGSLWAITVERHMNAAVDSLQSWPVASGNPVGTALATHQWNSAADTIGSVGNVAGNQISNIAPYYYEYVVAIPNGNTGKSQRRKVSFEAKDRLGNPIVASYISLRARLLVVYGQASCTTYAGNSSIELGFQAVR